MSSESMSCPKERSPWQDALQKVQNASSEMMKFMVMVPEQNALSFQTRRYANRANTFLYLHTDGPVATRPRRNSLGALPIVRAEDLQVEDQPQDLEARTDSPAGHGGEMVHESDDEDDEVARTYTTVMLQNLPRLFSQKALLAELEATGYGGTFDFCYAPIVFSTGKCLGYAFVNFRTHDIAAHFLQSWQGSQRLFPSTASTHDECLVTSVAKMQGLSMLLAQNRCRNRLQRVRKKSYRPFIAKDVELQLGLA
mmetsp:Transcript_55929/g.130973  ORF Transcript_55929/g.130973 Transcript_55929/m.130973 type:complete len:253 (+) Transcript_55929:106-864(+)